MHASPGSLFVIEGMDGSGKTTQIKAVSKSFADYGTAMPDLILTKEPGGTEWGQKLRALMLDGGTDNELAIALAMYSDRVETAQRIIKPAVEAGNVVLSDRSFLSTLAYQGITPWLYNTIDAIRVTLSYRIYEPTHVFLLDVPVDVAMGYSRKADVFERSGTGFYKGVRERYLEIAETYDPDRITVINGMLPEDEITELIIGTMVKYIESN